MTGFLNVIFRAAIVLVALGMMFVTLSCSDGPSGRGMIGRAEKYDYSPSVIQSGNVLQVWWCGIAVNPTLHSQETDTILYESFNLTTGETVGPLTVLAETKDAWDSVYLCNPKVIGGSFDNPLGDGQSFQYALYYVATSDGTTNDIGVAFSNDGIHWRKYPEPVIRKSSKSGYGVGQPAVYNSDHKAAISMFYEDWFPIVHHVFATSNDGVHFTVQGTLTTNGLNPDNPDPTWGDMAYDPTSDDWYAVYNSPIRDPATTGGVAEQGSYGVTLYKIPNDSLLTGSTPWQELDTIDTNMTGYESNHLAAFVRDPNGNITIGASSTLDLYISVTNPRPSWDASPASAAKGARPDSWDVAPIRRTLGSPLMELRMYYNGTSHVTTTGSISASGGFKLVSNLGHLYKGPQLGATVPFYACKSGSKDYFISLDKTCEGERVLGKNGYGYAQPDNSLNLVAIYRCSTKRDHFVSLDSKCEGETTDQLLGYVLP